MSTSRDSRQSNGSLVQIAPARNPIQQAIRDRYGTFRGLVRLVLGNFEAAAGRLTEFTPARDELARYTRLVFVCQGNICRSAYAEYRAHALGLPAVSIGLSTCSGQPAFHLTREAAERRGLNMTDHCATDFSDYKGEPGDLFLVMEVRQARKLQRLVKPSRSGIAMLGHWSNPRRIHIHDPFELEPAYFDTCFSVIDSAMANLSDDWIAAREPA